MANHAMVLKLAYALTRLLLIDHVRSLLSECFVFRDDRTDTEPLRRAYLTRHWTINGP